MSEAKEYQFFVLKHDETGEEVEIKLEKPVNFRLIEKLMSVEFKKNGKEFDRHWFVEKAWVK